MKAMIRLTMALAVLAPMGVLTAGATGAAAALPSCKTQTGTVVIAPPITNTAHSSTITATTKIAGCVGGGVTGGSGKAIIKTDKTSNCAGLGKTGQKSPISETITWNTKKTSTLTGGSVTGPKVGQATITLKVTKGLFIGKHASTVVAFTPGKGQDCVKGIKNLTIKGIKPLAFKA